MTTIDCEFEAPWLQSKRGRPEAALGAAVWLWMHDPRHRRESLQDMEHRLLAPIEAGQYLLARQRRDVASPVDAPQRPMALLLFARFDEMAESRYLAAPAQKIAMRDWQSGDRLWLIHWVAPFGHTTNLREPVLRLLAGRTAKSLRQPRQGSSSTRILLWQGALTRSRSAQRGPSGDDVPFDRETVQQRKEPAHRWQ